MFRLRPWRLGETSRPTEDALSIRDRNNGWDGDLPKVVVIGSRADLPAHLFFGEDDGDDNKSGGEDGGEAATGDNEEVTALKALLATSNSKLGEARESLGQVNVEAQGLRKNLEAFGNFTPDELAKMKTDKDESEQRDREAKGHYDEQLQLERANTLKAETEREKSEKAYQKTIIENSIVTAAASLQPLEAAMMPLTEGGSAQIVTATQDQFTYDPETRRVGHISKRNDKGEPMSPAEVFAAERTASLSIYFKTAQRSGSDAVPGQSGTNGGEAPISIRSRDDKKVELVEKAHKDGRKVILTDEAGKTVAGPF